MSFHRNAKLGLAGRYALVSAIEGGMTRRRTAGGTAGWRRTRRRGARSPVSSIVRAGRIARRGGWQRNSSRRSATVAAAPAGDHGWSPGRPASRTRPSRRCCGARASRGRRNGRRSRPTATSGPVPAICCTSTQAATRASSGLDTASPATAPSRCAAATTPVGYDFAHAIIDDHSRLTYVELDFDEKAATVTGLVERALAFFAACGIVSKRLMTDNAFAYVHNRSLRELLADRGIRHLTTEPYRPRTNGKVERFHQTMAREWAYGLAYRSSRHRNAALPHWLDHYNRTRPHSSTGDRPPISRVHNVRG